MDRSGQDLYLSIFIEGVNMLASKGVKIGAMLVRRQGDVAGLAMDLRQAG